MDKFLTNRRWLVSISHCFIKFHYERSPWYALQRVEVSDDTIGARGPDDVTEQLRRVSRKFEHRFTTARQ